MTHRPPDPRSGDHRNGHQNDRQDDQPVDQQGDQQGAGSIPGPTPSEPLARLEAAGLSLADLNILIGRAPFDASRRALLPAAHKRLRLGLPRSGATWGPYLQLLCDGLPEVCPCPCPTCAAGPSAL